jgi:hypothetical protein
MSGNPNVTPSTLFASPAARKATALKGGKRRSTRRRRSKASKKRRSQ